MGTRGGHHQRALLASATLSLRRASHVVPAIAARWPSVFGGTWRPAQQMMIVVHCRQHAAPPRTGHFTRGAIYTLAPRACGWHTGSRRSEPSKGRPV